MLTTSTYDVGSVNMWFPKRLRARTLGYIAVIVLACGWFGCCALARLARGDAEWRVISAKPESFGLTAQRVEMQSADRLRVVGWWIAASRDKPGRATVILVPGRGNNRGTMLSRAKFLVAAGYDAFAIDLRAHGESEGEYPSPGDLEVAGTDAAIAPSRLASSRPIVLLGHSAGAVAVLHATSRAAPIVGTIADSPFITAFDVFYRYRAIMRRDGSSIWPRIGLWFAGNRSLAGVTSWMLRMGGGGAIDARCADLLPVLPKITVPV